MRFAPAELLMVKPIMMNKLIQGQTIRIDDHKRGDKSETKWSENLHLHKVFNNDRFSGAEVLIPLNSDMELKFRKIKGSPIQQDRIVKEISKAFKDPKKRKEFIKDVLDQIERFSQNAPLFEKAQNLAMSLEALIKHFDLKPAYLIDFNTNWNNKLSEILTKHEDKESKEYFILQNLKDKSILIGEDLEIIDDWKDIMKRFNSKD